MSAFEGVVTQVGGVSLAEIAERFGTPTYVYDQAAIERRIDTLSPFPTIRYAQKANSNLAILDLMRRRGVVVDAVSVGEVQRALKAGYAPEQIVYTADILTRQSIDVITQHGLRLNCGSTDMIEQFAERNAGRPITLRINPGFGHGHSQKTNTGGVSSKHGIWHEELPDALRRAKAAGVPVTGIHMHIGSGTDFEHLSQVAGALSQAARQVGPELEIISCGGGLPIPYRPGDRELDIPAYADLWHSTREALSRELGRELELEVEPGRYLVADAGHLVCEVRAIKRQGDRQYYLVDAGFNMLARPILYGAYHPITICPRVPTPDDGTRQEVYVGGPLCESGDIFTQAEGGFVEPRSLPPAKVGDLLTLHDAGAYAFVMASNYNGMPLPPEVLLRDGQAIEVRPRQPIEQLFAGETIPQV